MTADIELNKAEKRGYAKGYSAGLRRRRKDRENEHRYRERQSFLDRAFLAALSAVVSAQGWKSGEKPIINVPDRVALAADFAMEALKKRPFA